MGLETLDTPQTEAGAVVDATLHLARPVLQPIARGSHDEASVLVVPKGKDVISVKKFLDEYRPAPERRIGTAQLTTLESFIDHVKRHKDGDSIIFADVENRLAPKMIGVIDYQKAGGPGVGDPRWGQHRAVYQFPVSTEWTAWTQQDGKAFTQEAFAGFLEDRITDVLDPANVGELTRKFAEDLGVSLAGPLRLMELSRGLSVRVGAKVVSHVNLSTGEAQIGFEEQHQGEDGAALKIPGAFALSIPVFRGGALYTVPVRLRYRVQGGGVSWSYSLARVDRIWDHAINEAAQKAKDETGLPVLFGRSEQ